LALSYGRSHKSRLAPLNNLYGAMTPYFAVFLAGHDL